MQFPIFSLRVSDSASVVVVNVDAVTARRTVSGWVGGYVSTSCKGHTPELVIEQDHPFWRVPVVFTRVGVGIVGEIGFVMVDAQTGEMLDATEQHATEMIESGVSLVRRIPAPPFKIRTPDPQYVQHA